MTTDQPRAGGPDATPGPAATPESAAPAGAAPSPQAEATPESAPQAEATPESAPQAEATPEPARSTGATPGPTSGAGATPRSTPQAEATLRADARGVGIPGAGSPPPGPAVATFRTRPAGPPIPGAGVPPPGPASVSVPRQSTSQPEGAASSGAEGSPRIDLSPPTEGSSRSDVPPRAEGSSWTAQGSSRSEVERARMGLTDAELTGTPAAPPATPVDRLVRRFAPQWLRRRVQAGARTPAATPVTAATAGTAPATAGTAAATAGTAAATAAAAGTATPGTAGTATSGTNAATPAPTATAIADPGTIGATTTTTAGTTNATLAPAHSPPAGRIAVDEKPPPAAPSPTNGSSPANGTPATRKRKPLPADRPPGAPPDPWTAFVTTEDRPLSRRRRALHRLGRALIHEYALATYAAVLLAVVLTWPTLRYPLYTLPQDLYDPARQAWQVAWAGHVLVTDPVQLWQANAFFPERYSFAYGNSLLGYAPAGMIGNGPAAAILRYNILFVLAHALLALGAYALVRQLGAGRTGAAVAAAAFAYAPWRLAQEGHLDIVSAGGIPLALAMLARGHGWSMRHGLRPGRRHAGWAAAGWAVAAWQVSLGFSLGLPFAYVLAGIIVVVAVAVPVRRWRKRAAGPVLGWRLLVTDLLGALILAGIGALIAIPYFRAPDTGSRVAEIDFFSPPLRGLLIGPAESRIWGAAHAVPRSSLGWPAEMSLLPGFVLYALALVGLVFSVWKVWQRLLLLLGLAVAVILTLGTTFFDGRWTYLPLFGHLPASFGVRIPGRLIVWVTLLLAILAAGAVAEFVRRGEQLAAQRTPPWPSPWLRVAMLVPMLLVLVESWNATAHPLVPAQPAAMRTVNEPMLVLPTAALGDQTVMLWSTFRFQPIANGAGGFAAQQQAELRQAVATFPDAGSIQYLRETGISKVLLVRSLVAGTPWELTGDIPVDALGIRREDLDDDAVLFHLN